jgi:hypothetical protein
MQWFVDAAMIQIATRHSILFIGTRPWVMCVGDAVGDMKDKTYPLLQLITSL